MISKTWRTSFLKSVRLETDGVKDVSQVQGSDISAACRRNLRAWYSYSNFAIVITNGSGFAFASKVEQHHDEHRARNDLETSGPVRSAPPVNSREFLTWHRVALNRRMPTHYTSAIPCNWDRARPPLMNWHVLTVTQSCHFRLKHPYRSRVVSVTRIWWMNEVFCDPGTIRRAKQTPEQETGQLSQIFKGFLVESMPPHLSVERFVINLCLNGRQGNSAFLFD